MHVQNIGCENIAINCTRGSQCKVDETVHQAYCEPSCDLDNGGCADNEVCSLQQQRTCTSGPCPPVVKCSSELLMMLNRSEIIYYVLYLYTQQVLISVCNISCLNNVFSIIQIEGCGNITINCTRGSQCKVDETVQQAYCKPSCDLDNGGCADNEVCSLSQPVTCVDPPCPSIVQCAGEFITSDEYVCMYHVIS